MGEPSGSLASTRWDPAQYARFGGHRLRPALELLARVTVTAPRTVVDLGCGTGAVTRLLAERWPAAKVWGIDHSPQMIAVAAAEPGAVEWVETDLTGWSPAEPVDLIFSNAALHWVGEHGALLRRLLGLLAPGGCLAVQMPQSFDLPSHRLLRETLAAGGPGGTPIGGEALRVAAARRPVGDPAAYLDLLAGRAQHVDVWSTEYLQVLHGDDPVFEWVRGTGLRPVLAGLDGGELAAFLAAYRARLRAAYPRRADGSTVYPFRRLFVVAAV